MEQYMPESMTVAITCYSNRDVKMYSLARELLGSLKGMVGAETEKWIAREKEMARTLIRRIEE